MRWISEDVNFTCPRGRDGVRSDGAGWVVLSVVGKLVLVVSVNVVMGVLVDVVLVGLVGLIKLVLLVSVTLGVLMRRAGPWGAARIRGGGFERGLVGCPSIESTFP